MTDALNENIESLEARLKELRRARKAFAASERMKRLNADPEFKAKIAASASERMKRLHADPEFKAKIAASASERMKRLNADPEFKAKIAASASERMKRLHADPEFRKDFKLPPLSPERRKIYTKLRAVVGREVALQEALR